MKIVILGSGNVAFHLAKVFHQKNIPVSQIFGRNEADLKHISTQFNIPFSTHIIDNADFYIIAVNDDSVSEISKKITSENCLVAHTSGSLPVDILQGIYRKASFYPLQTFSKSKELDYSEIPFFLEAETGEDLEMMKNLVSKISQNVIESNYEKRKYIHLTAVFACNFVNHLFSQAKEISDSQEIPFQYFLPLIEETTAKIATIDPKLAQTGPAVRNDQRILKLHEELLSDPEKLKIYKTMNESIKKMYEL